MPLKIGEKQEHYDRVMKENLQAEAEEEKRKKAKEQLETQGAELEGARAELMGTQAELAKLKEEFSKHREDALMEVSQLQAQADDTERKLAGVPEGIATTKTAALTEYQSSAEFEQVQVENFDDNVCTFIYNVCRQHLE